MPKTTTIHGRSQGSAEREAHPTRWARPTVATETTLTHQPGSCRSTTTRTRSRPATAGRRCSRTSTSARRSPTSTTSGSRSGSSTRAAPAAHGVFRSTSRWRELTQGRRSSTDPARETPVFVRFSTVAGSRGSTDLARDVRGFAVKFYTDEGNFDLVGNNMPVFFIQDAIKFPDLIHAVKPEPHNEIPQAASAHDTFWDFISLMPESMHMVMWLMSDRAIPRSYRMMEGFGVHTFRLVNAEGHVALREVPLEAAARRPLASPGTRRRRSPARTPTSTGATCGRRSSEGNFPEYELGLQIVEEKDEFAFGFDLLDPTKIIPEELVPVAARRAADAQPQPGQLLRRDRAGRLPHRPRRARHRLHQRPAAPGPPVLLHRHAADPPRRARTSTRSRSTGRSRPSTNNQRDGFMRQAIDRGRGELRAELARRQPAGPGAGGRRRLRHLPGADRGRRRSARRGASFFDHYSQARMFFRSQSEPEQQHLIKALRFELGQGHDARRPRADGRPPRADRRDAGDAGRQGPRARGPGEARAAAEPERPGRRRPRRLTSTASSPIGTSSRRR